MTVFSRFAPRLQQAIVARLGWSSLRPVQEQAGEKLLAGHNAVILAPTAGGKTEAAMFPLLSDLVEDQPIGLGALYIAPIKALLNNQAERLGVYTGMVDLSRFVWHGDVGTSRRQAFLRAPATLLMTTPESLEVQLVSQKVDALRLFREVRAVVVDEIHALAGTDRGAHLLSVLERIARISRHDLQRVGLSATVGNPAAILGWLQGTSARPGAVIDPPHPPSPRRIAIAFRPALPDQPDSPSLTAAAAQVARGCKSLFFCQSRARTEAVAEAMRRQGVEVFVHHSSVSRAERELAEERFHRGAHACIACTSTLELGIDVGDLDKVLQHEAPATVSSFVQRMGRTGRRAGRVANTTFFCESTESVLQATALVELARARWIEDVELSDRCWPVLIHQLLAMALAENGVRPEACWEHLHRLPDFRGIQRAEFDRLLAWMQRDGSLLLTSGLLVLGPKAERKFGRRNFMQLYAVFSSPQSYLVETAEGLPIGSLTQAFVDNLVDQVSSFLLAGRAWTVQRILHDERRVKVNPAPRGQQPSWAGSFIPQFLSREVSQKMLEILTSRTRYPYLRDNAARSLDAQRELYAGVLRPGEGGLQVSDDGSEVTWWTFAGGRINSTLRYALSAFDDTWKISASSEHLTVKGEGSIHGPFQDAVARLEELETWEDTALWKRVYASLPAFRLSKFQALMPPWVEREMIATYLLDLDGAWRWLSGTRAAEPQGAELGAVLAKVARASSTAAAAEAPEVPVAPEVAVPVPTTRPDGRALRWVEEQDAFEEACRTLSREPLIGLDVETTIRDQRLCLIQIASPSTTYLIDPLAVANLLPLGQVLGARKVRVVIHNASFERRVLGRYELAIENVVDTLRLSRQVRGKVEGGHSLKAVCARELGIALDKGEQTSNWARRPLSPAQIAYAALDAEVLLQLLPILEGDDQQLRLGTW